jgi:hypothetical protein
VGELKIQIKKIPKDALRFDCPIELVAYSQRVSSPFILICVDVDNQKAYWQHISPLMPGFKPEQKTFTAKFQPEVDEIRHGSPYFDRWKALCNDYIKRVSHYPGLQRIIDEQIGLANLDSNDRIFFQEFIDEVNLLLDVDMPVVKHEYFANAWKLGVCIHQADEKVVCYTIYTIEKGENSALVAHVPRSISRPLQVPADDNVISWYQDCDMGSEVSLNWIQRPELKCAKTAARSFVFDCLDRLLRNKQLHVHGKHQSIELLFWFLRLYSHSLGLPEKDTYKTSEIAYGLAVYFPVWYGIAFSRVMKELRSNYPEMIECNPLPSFDQIANKSRKNHHPHENDVRKIIASRLRASPTPIRETSFSLKSLWQAIDYLKSESIDEFSRSDRPRKKTGKWIWELYLPEDLNYNVRTMIREAIEDYPIFVKGNQFGRLESSLINQEKVFVFVSKSGVSQDNRSWPSSIVGYLVDNVDRALPPMTFIDLNDEPNACCLRDHTLTIRGLQRNLLLSWGPMVSCFHEDRKVQALTYELLKMDLKRRFGRSFG